MAQPLNDDEQRRRDYEEFLLGAQKLGYSALDIATLPGRAVGGAVNTGVVRPLRMLGAPVPYIPPSYFGGNSASMTPYFDRLRSADASQPAAQVPQAAQPTAEALLESPFGDVNLGYGAAMSAAGGKPASLYSVDPELALLEANRAARGKLGAVPQKTLKREERIQQAIAANPQVSKDDIRLSESDKNQMLIKLGLSILGNGGMRPSESLGKAGLVAQEYAQQRKDLTLAEKKEQRAERLRQADALLRAAGEDTSEYNAQQTLTRATELQKLGADFESARAGATMKGDANRNRIANSELEARRGNVAVQAKLADPKFRAQALKNIAAVEANPAKYSREVQLEAQYWKALLGIDKQEEKWQNKDLAAAVELLLNRGDLDTPTKFTEAGSAMQLPEDTIRAARASRFGAAK